MHKEKSSLHKLYGLLSRKDKLRFVILNILMVINAFLELVGIGAIPGLILIITNPERLENIPFLGHHFMAWHQQNSQEMFFFAIIGLFLVFLIKNLFGVFLNYLKGKFVRSIQVDLSQQLMKKYLGVSYSFHLSASIAELMRNVNGEVNQIVNQVLIQLLELLLNLMMGLAILMLLFFAEPLVSLSAMSIFGLVSFIFLRVTRKKIKFYGKEALRMRNLKNKMVLNSLNLVKEVKILGKEQFFSQRFHQAIRSEAYVTMHKTVMEKLPRAILEVLAIGLMLSIILTMVFQQRDMSDMIATLALFAVAAARLMPVANQVSTAITNVRYALPSIDPIYEDLTKIREEVVGREINFGNMKDGILKIQDLSFTYAGQETHVLKDLNFEIRLGISVAFVGTSGAGKSTLVDLLIGILEPTSGSILCNNKDISQGLQSWRKRMGYIPQQITLINDSLLNNICLGEDPSIIDMNRVFEVIRLAQLAEFVASLSEGLHTLVGDKGVRLSGGQRQRVGIARALYHNPPILVMDEATSALDNITEKFIVEALETLKGGRTIIMIAHRLTTVKNCDIIFFLKDGKIVDKGTYSELIKRNDAFQKLAMVE